MIQFANRLLALLLKQALQPVEERLDRIIKRQTLEAALMATKFDELTQRITALTSVGDSLVELTAGLAEEVRQLKGAPTDDQIEDLAGSIEAKRAEWAAAVVANTPAAPAEPVTEPEVPPVEEPAATVEPEGTPLI